MTAGGPSQMLRGVIALGVQTWGTDAAALRRYWAAADDGGFARVLYGDGLWDWTHDGWVMLGALACLGFADFPDTRMLTLFTERVLPQLAQSDRC